MTEQLSLLATDTGDILPIIAVAGGLAFAFFISIAGMIQSYARTRQREQTKREVAAYIAEGSMTPEEGERIIRAGSEDAKKGGSWF
jgi:hypothetical protein